MLHVPLRAQCLSVHVVLYAHMWLLASAVFSAEESKDIFSFTSMGLEKELLF